MYKEISLTNTNFTNLNLAKVKCEPTNTCPICKSKISPVPLYSIAYDKESRTYASLLNYCNGCHSTFISNYEVGSSISSPHRIAATSYIGSEPNHYVKQEFDEKITTVSPQFEKIYNQALAAESSGLDEIAGLGYRKSLEFLIKDFAIHIYPDEADAIKNKPLSQCIKKYIDDSRIVTLAERSAWIGNDEAHYIRKQEDRDVSDMKNFIKAIIYFIGMVLITEDAATMTSKN